ncbi:putative Copper-transporting ATPase PAA2, chloroplastic [Nannochloris sp. 'desiccata']|nr:hypothetical protein KSW81_001522 [Chlorella desiccata (nom. nud.)]KAH7616813.1 putative Copper-transporting ATPase PAA2, chloroplastic [Chlorella desiccata (nom. nud.)]
MAMHCTTSFGTRPGFGSLRGVGIAPRLTTPLLAHLPHRKFNRLPAFHICASLSTVTLEKEASEVKEGTQAAATPVVLTVRGMKCGGCSAAVKRMLLQQPGISSAAVNLLTETAVIQVVSDAPAEVAEQAAGVLGSKGFPAELRKADKDDIANAAIAISERKAQELKESTRNLAFAWTLAFACYGHHLGHFLHALGMHEYAHTGFMSLLGNPVVSGVIGAAAMLGPGRQLLFDGALSLFRGAPNMNSLIALGASTSFTAGLLSATIPDLTIDPSFLEEPVMLLAFVLLGRSLEARARAKASMDLTTLAQLIPSSARLLLDSGVKPGAAADSNDVEDQMMVPTSTVRAGDVLRILPGERIPVDGSVISGKCCVDESMLTGESELITKNPEDSVTGGTVAYEAPIVIRATATGSSSTLAGIGRLVTEAQSREAPVQRLADVVAGYFCYSVMSLSAATFLFWYTTGNAWYPQALDAVDVDGASASLLLSVKLAIDVLVVACPCALGLATPTAVLVASSAGARRGLLIRGGDILERLAKIDTVVLDKTGTLTEGKLRLKELNAFAGYNKNDILALAAGVESLTTHPLAVAVKQAAANEGLLLPSASNSYTEPGEGVFAVVEGRGVYVGRRSWVESRVGAVSPLPNSGSKSTTVWVGVDGRGIAGKLEFSDTLREDAKQVVKELRGAGKKVVLLSGDDEDVARSAALEAGIQLSNVYGRVKPEGKAIFVTQLREKGASVAMIGDGVNDAVALSAADVGMAMGGGTDAAGAAADVILMGDRLGQAVEALRLGGATLDKIKQNLGLAVVYNVIGIPLAAGALLPSYGIALTPTVAAGMMACSSIVVVANSLLLRDATVEQKSS